MTLADIKNYVYRRTKTNASKWGVSNSDLLIAINNSYERVATLMQNWFDNYTPTAFTSADLTTGTATPKFNSLFHEIIPLWICYDYANTNGLKSASGFWNEITRKEQQLESFYGSRNNQIFTVTIASPAVFTKKSHGLVNNDTVLLTTTGALPTGLSVDTYYYVVSAEEDTFQVSSTIDGTAITTTGSQSGTHYYTSDRKARLKGNINDSCK